LPQATASVAEERYLDLLKQVLTRLMFEAPVVPIQPRTPWKAFVYELALRLVRLGGRSWDGWCEPSSRSIHMRVSSTWVPILETRWRLPDRPLTSRWYASRETPNASHFSNKTSSSSRG